MSDTFAEFCHGNATHQAERQIRFKQPVESRPDVQFDDKPKKGGIKVLLDNDYQVVVFLVQEFRRNPGGAIPSHTEVNRLGGFKSKANTFQRLEDHGFIRNEGREIVALCEPAFAYYRGL